MSTGREPDSKQVPEPRNLADPIEPIATSSRATEPRSREPLTSANRWARSRSSDRDGRWKNVGKDRPCSPRPSRKSCGRRGDSGVDGEYFFSHAKLDGRDAFRVAIWNIRTTESDLQRLRHLLQALARASPRSHVRGWVKIRLWWLAQGVQFLRERGCKGT